MTGELQKARYEPKWPPEAAASDYLGASARADNNEMEPWRQWRVEKRPSSHPELIMPARRLTLRVQPPNPFGEVTMVPATLSGRSETDMARAMAAAFPDEPTSVSDIVHRLRHSFPGAPLSERVAALSVIVDRLRHPF